MVKNEHNLWIVLLDCDTSELKTEDPYKNRYNASWMPLNRYTQSISERRQEFNKLTNPKIISGMTAAENFVRKHYLN